MGSSWKGGEWIISLVDAGVRETTVPTLHQQSLLTPGKKQKPHTYTEQPPCDTPQAL